MATVKMSDAKAAKARKAKTRNANARKALVTICELIGCPQRIKKLGPEWYILHLHVTGGAILELQTGGEGSTDVHWEVVGGPYQTGQVSFDQVGTAGFQFQLRDLIKSLSKDA